MFYVQQIDDKWGLRSEEGGDLFASYEAAVTAGVALVAAAGDTGLLADVWHSDMVFQAPTGDGRDFSTCLFSWRDPMVSTLPLMLQTETEMGHFGAELAGFISTIGGQNPVRATGRFYDSEIGKQARDMLQGNRKFGVSVDPGSVEISCSEEDEFGFCIGDLIFNAYEIIGLTMTPFPGFAGASIVLDDGTQSVAASAPARPPRAWFEMPEPQRGDDLLVPQSTGGYAVPLTITDEGQVYGHIADSKRCHIGFADRCRTAPPSACAYREFHLGATVCDDGETVATGPLVCGAMHASTARGVNAGAARDHYANSALAWANVRVVDGQFGPWACGVLHPDVTETQLAVFRSLSLSGDWRQIDGRLELIACLTVNTPGFPIERELAASGMEVAEVGGARALIEGDELVSLVAAGVVRRCPDCEERAREQEGMSVLERRLDTLERKLGILSVPMAEELRRRVHVA